MIATQRILPARHNRPVSVPPARPSPGHLSRRFSPPSLLLLLSSSLLSSSTFHPPRRTPRARRSPRSFSRLRPPSPAGGDAPVLTPGADPLWLLRHPRRRISRRILSPAVAAPHSLSPSPPQDPARAIFAHLRGLSNACGHNPPPPPAPPQRPRLRRRLRLRRPPPLNPWTAR